MAKLVILNTVDWVCCHAVAAGELSEEEAIERLLGRAWLLRARAEVDDVEEAVRAAVVEHFASEEGRRTLEGEGLEALGWNDAIPWVPDVVWARHGLEIVRHPDAERVLLDSEENLLEAIAAHRPG